MHNTLQRIGECLQLLSYTSTVTAILIIKSSLLSVILVPQCNIKLPCCFRSHCMEYHQLVCVLLSCKPAINQGC